MSKHPLALIAAKAALGAALTVGFWLSPPAVADHTVTVDGVDRPVCELEDGSDLPPALLPCVWTDPVDGTAWLTFETHSVVITR